MSPKRCIVVTGLDTSVRSIVNECLPSDHFDIAEFDENTGVASTGHVDLVIFGAPNNLELTQELCATLRSRIGEGAPLLCCAGRQVSPGIKELLGNAVQSMVITPLNADELRQKLDELDLGF